MSVMCREMLRARIDPDEYTIVALLTTVSRTPGAEVEIRKVDRIMELRARYGIKLNKYIFGSLVQAYRKCFDVAPAQRCRLAEAVLEEAIMQGVQLNAFVMTAMIVLYWDACEYEKAKKQYDTMIDMEISPTYNTCEVMSGLCAEVGWVDEAVEFRKLQHSLSTFDSGA